MFEPIIDEDDLQDNLLGSNFQRRVLRALYYIHNEPSGSASRFKERLQLRAQTSKLSAEEVIAQTYSFVNSQLDKHQRANPMHLESEESMVKLMEQGRLTRLQGLGLTVLVEGLGLISASRHDKAD
jgi:hypothetical protein